MTDLYARFAAWVRVPGSLHWLVVVLAIWAALIVVVIAMDHLLPDEWYGPQVRTHQDESDDWPVQTALDRERQVWAALHPPSVKPFDKRNFQASHTATVVDLASRQRGR